MANETSGNPGANGTNAGIGPANQVIPYPKEPQHPTPPIFGHNVFSASSLDGRAWNPDGILIKSSASVPEPFILNNGTMALYYVDGIFDTMDCSLSNDGMNFSYGNCTINGFTEMHAWDPDVVRLDNGSYRMYFLAPAPQRNSSIMSAISNDGVNWLEEPGVRFAHDIITDPSVVRTDDGWIIYLFHAPNVLIARSKDGINFDNESELGMGGSVVDVVRLDSGEYAMYLDCIEMATSNDGAIWTNPRKIPAVMPGVNACSPGVTKMDGIWKMYYLVANNTN
jgi:hypothetical protein